MKITFLLTGPGDTPIGGFKVVYEYANGLVRRGHQVTVVHPAQARIDTARIKYFEKRLRYLRRKLDSSYRPHSWFDLDERVRLLWTPSLHARYIPDGHALVATAWSTAEWAAAYPLSKGRRYYLLQHLETWAAEKHRVLDTWRLPFHKIVIALWLQRIAQDMGEQATYIPNGLDFRAFGIDIPPEVRSSKTVMMLFHKADWKGSADGIAALNQVKDDIADLKAVFFGIESRPQELPMWVEYHKMPSQKLLRELYNRASIFIGPSWTEGWGLPPAEAMLCGCAVALTDNGGHREFAQQNITALLSAPRDPPALATNIKQLVQNPELRLRLARMGNKYVQRFHWDKSITRFEQALGT
ncbi:MAG: glycosyltransferase family 4 protein [Gammaproteobacteria bacterium]